ncbi:amidase domain-containing protein [Streptomyces spinosirectus]|uniref:amidase domain-containing protein n=1 Tax=Streptomyces TaxID=1883 RepID=UPI001C9DCB2D|nr:MULTISPECIES: amidase domain-containing protein [Streptomyces]MBY8342539.1 amidase domain-containing protein [Streptomyces plumbidurans]UIR17853.1 amidase domain-containing protein [Streptomyces spinosirectus]
MRRTALAALSLSTALLPLSAANATADAPAKGTPTPEATATTVDAFARAADTLFTDRTTALVEKPSPSGRTASRTTGAVRLAAAAAKSEATALTTLHATRSRLADAGEAYTGSDTEVTVDSVQVRGRTATAQVTENSTLTYARIRGDEPATTAFVAHHELTFAAAPDGTWQLTGERLTDQGPRPLNEPVRTTAPAAPDAARPSDVIDAPRAAITYPAPARAKNLGAGAKYKYAAMAAYAEKYWKYYNSAYRQYGGDGGDCTNFLSQALYAGGWKQVTRSGSDYGTWYSKASGESLTWIGVNEWSWFTQTARRTTPLANAYQMDIGDVLQLDFDANGSKEHSMLTTYRSASGVPYLTYHSADTYRRSLTSLIAANPDAAYYAYRS